MADDFNNLRKPKKKLVQPTENVVDIKQPPHLKSASRIRFVITKNKNNSWVDDLHALEQLNLAERVFH